MKNRDFVSWLKTIKNKEIFIKLSDDEQIPLNIFCDYEIINNGNLLLLCPSRDGVNFSCKQAAKTIIKELKQFNDNQNVCLLDDKIIRDFSIIKQTFYRFKCGFSNSMKKCCCGGFDCNGEFINERTDAPKVHSRFKTYIVEAN